MNRIRSGVALLALLLSVADAQPTTPNPSPRTIEVSGQSVLYVEPDHALLSFGVVASDNDIVQAKARSAAILKKAMAGFLAHGVREKDVRTSYYAINPQWEHRNTGRELVGYEARNTVVVTLRDVSTLESVVASALLAGVTEVHGIELRTSEDRKHRDAAREQALIAAKEKARAMAAVLGQSIGRPLSIVEAGAEGPSPYARVSNTLKVVPASEESTAGDVPLGTIPIRASVSVVFELAP